MPSSTARSSAISHDPISGDSAPISPSFQEAYILRPLWLSDIPTLGELNKRAYWGSDMNNFLYPRAAAHPEQLARRCRQSIRRQYVNPSCLSVVACPAGHPKTPIAFTQSERVGDDEGAREFVREKGRAWLLWLYMLSWVFWIYDKIDLWVWPDTISDVQNLKTFGEWQKLHSNHWTMYPERKNRWQAMNVVVGPEYQGKGVGKLLMKALIERAQIERIPIGLSASTHGRYLYSKLGFEALGDFTGWRELWRERGVTVDPGGGIMCWFPEGWEWSRKSELGLSQ